MIACLSGVSHRCLLHSHACVCIRHLVSDPSHHIDISQCCCIITHSYSISYTHFHRLSVVLHHTPSSNIPTLSLPSTTPTSHSPTLTHFTFYIIFYRFRRYNLINSHFNIVTTSFSTTQIQIYSNFRPLAARDTFIHRHTHTNHTSTHSNFTVILPYYFHTIPRIILPLHHPTSRYRSTYFTIHRSSTFICSNTRGSTNSNFISLFLN